MGEILMCVGGPNDGLKRDCNPDHGIVRMVDQTKPRHDTLYYVDYQVQTLHAGPSLHERFRFLVPVGTTPAEAIRDILAGYRAPPVPAGWTKS